MNEIFKKENDYKRIACCMNCEFFVDTKLPFDVPIPLGTCSKIIGGDNEVYADGQCRLHEDD
jgi:hypothetical protein